jgi:hydroxymethyl cephem carbamoyltransferase
MVVLGIQLGHDGAICAVKDREVLFCLESEKDSYLRHSKLTPTSIVAALERLGEAPDIVAMGGTLKEDWWYQGSGNDRIEAGYYGGDVLTEREGTFCGMKLPIISSSHVRTHVMGAAGMAPPDDAKCRAVLVWEGYEGSFYLLDENWELHREIRVLDFPGGRYAFLFGLAEPTVPDWSGAAHTDLAGKLMALASFADPSDADAEITATVDRLLRPGPWATKGNWNDSTLYNAGVEAEVTKVGGALLQHRIFEMFAKVAQQELPRDIPLYIAGGCGLNCDWNTMWRELGHFSSVFIPPCANDSGSALGTALDALHAKTGDPRVNWDVYCGEEFDWDSDPAPNMWQRKKMQYGEVADALASGRVFAWVQGRWELGPRALGNRSLLANPFDPATRDLLNEIKQREDYRPIAPVARMEDVPKVFDRDFHDPYMLHFRMVTSPDLGAITHVDGSARVQTVTKETNRTLHDLLSAFAERHGVGVLCNTSLNFKGMGFINRMSDLTRYCEARGVGDFVVGDAWYQRADERAPAAGHPETAGAVSG